MTIPSQQYGEVSLQPVETSLLTDVLEIWNSLFTPAIDQGPEVVPTVTALLNAFLPIVLVGFVVTLLLSPVARWLAIKLDIVDRPDGKRKIHRVPVAYLGGASVFAGVLAAIFTFDLLMRFDVPKGEGWLLADYPPVPLAVVFGLFAIFVTGLLDDVFHWDPRLKIAGQLIAAAALALTDVGTGAMQGLISPVLISLVPDGVQPVSIGVANATLSVWSGIDPADATYTWRYIPWLTADGVYYWIGVAFIGAMVLGACNAANLIDGLDGLLTGSVSLMSVGFAVVAITLAILDVQERIEFEERSIAGVTAVDSVSNTDEFQALVNDPTDQFTRSPGSPLRSQAEIDPMAGARIAIALAVLGACLGFLPYNFNPAVMFLGDAGSLMLGFLCAVLIIMLGSEGRTHYVVAGLLIFALPIIDTVLAIIRRKLAGLSMSTADRNHIHHMMLRACGSVKKAVMCLYGLNVVFVLLGVGLAMTVAFGGARYLMVYGVATLVFGFIGAIAVKTALRDRWIQQGSPTDATPDQ